MNVVFRCACHHAGGFAQQSRTECYEEQPPAVSRRRVPSRFAVSKRLGLDHWGSSPSQQPTLADSLASAETRVNDGLRRVVQHFRGPERKRSTALFFSLVILLSVFHPVASSVRPDLRRREEVSNLPDSNTAGCDWSGRCVDHVIS
jgi:hypothetical protein